MITFFIISLSISLGFILGSLLKERSWENQEWEILRWDKNLLGYRPAQAGSRIYKGEKIMMSLSLKTSLFPDGGLTVE